MWQLLQLSDLEMLLAAATTRRQRRTGAWLLNSQTKRPAVGCHHEPGRTPLPQGQALQLCFHCHSKMRGMGWEEASIVEEEDLFHGPNKMLCFHGPSKTKPRPLMLGGAGYGHIKTKARPLMLRHREECPEHLETQAIPHL